MEIPWLNLTPTMTFTKPPTPAFPTFISHTPLEESTGNANTKGKKNLTF